VNEPTVKVRYYAALRAKAGVEEEDCRASNVKQALNQLRKKHSPEFGKVLNSCHIYINQDSITFLKGASTKLKEGDVMHILPPAGGG